MGWENLSEEIADLFGEHEGDMEESMAIAAHRRRTQDTEYHRRWLENLRKDPVRYAAHREQVRETTRAWWASLPKERRQAINRARYAQKKAKAEKEQASRSRPVVLCACGCGQALTVRSEKRGGRFLLGHHGLQQATTSREVLRCLASGPKTRNAIAEALGKPERVVSKHLSRLKARGLVVKSAARGGSWSIAGVVS